MRGHALMPLIDLVFLTLGSVLAAMTQMERVTALPVTVVESRSGGAVVQHGEFDVVVVTDDTLHFNEMPVTQAELGELATGGRVVLRIAPATASERTLTILGDLYDPGADVTLEVKQINPLRGNR